MLENKDIVYNGIKLYKLRQKAFDYYRLGTRGNIDITEDEARRKLTRNIMLASVTSNRKYQGNEYTTYYYGALKIETCNEWIIKVKQCKYPYSEFELHRKRYAKLSKKLDLVEN